MLMEKAVRAAVLVRKGLIRGKGRGVTQELPAPRPQCCEPTLSIASYILFKKKKKERLNEQPTHVLHNSLRVCAIQ